MDLVIKRIGFVLLFLLLQTIIVSDLILFILSLITGFINDDNHNVNLNPSFWSSGYSVVTGIYLITVIYFAFKFFYKNRTWNQIEPYLIGHIDTLHETRIILFTIYTSLSGLFNFLWMFVGAFSDVIEFYGKPYSTLYYVNVLINSVFKYILLIFYLFKLISKDHKYSGNLNSASEV